MFERLRSIDAKRLRRFATRKAKETLAEARAFAPRAQGTPRPLQSLLTSIEVEFLRAKLDAKSLCQAASDHRSHLFDLLGSGPTLVAAKAPARLSQRHRARQRSLLEGLPGDYSLIDWHVDFKSGHRFDPTQWHTRVKYGQTPGVDVKVPWELGRLQHLPQLALAFIADGENHWAPREIECQLTDFIAQNPVGFGVNWACTMDVGIRAANIALTYDLLVIAGHRPPSATAALWSRTVQEHAEHIVHNLEWYPFFRSNHYFANVVGLLFASAYAPDTEPVRAWRSFAAAEVVHEVNLQFLDDGGNFEGSTSYHRLSTEMALYGLALAERYVPSSNVDPQHLPARPAYRAASRAQLDEALCRLSQALFFSEATTKPTGDVVQVGDNDSGRFFKIGEAARVLDHRHLQGAAAGTFVGPLATCESVIVGALRGAPPRSRPARRACRFPTEPWHHAGYRTEYSFAAPSDLRHALTAQYFPDFGLVVLRSPRLFASVRAGSVGQRGLGGHAHEDQLAVELEIDGESVLRDPGTHVYTPDPASRRLYRSADAHATPGSAAQPQSPLFELYSLTQGRILHVDTQSVVARQGSIALQLRVESDYVAVTTWNETRSLVANRNLAFSPEYGVLDE